MIKTQQLVLNEKYDPTDLKSTRFVWEYKEAGRNVQVGDEVQFTASGRGRGGHGTVTALVTKVNRKSFRATEVSGSYSPGTLWNYLLDDESNVYIQLPMKV